MSIKNVGMITLHSLHNCGSKLQTYALYNFLNSIDNVKCEVIDFIPSALSNKRAFRIAGELEEKYSDEIIIREQKFEMFSKNFLSFSPKQYHSDEEIQKNPPVYDVYVSGSDQIWNANFRIASTAYFLGFTDSRDKFAFSPSVGRCLEERLIEYKEYLMKYKKIWVREKSGAERIKNVTKRDDIGWMIDPALLYDSVFYDSLIDTNRVVDGKYIACYSTLDDQLDLMMPILRKLNEMYDLPILLFGGVVPREEPWIINKVDIGPLDFLKIIRDAELVFTQTFHGTLFSLIYNKQFVVFNDKMPNYRKTGILEELGLLNRVAHNENELENALCKELNYNNINFHIKKLRANARNNILNCMEEYCVEK